MDTEYPQSAFSLIELSIVLVILGLLVGGVLSEQSLIRTAELRSVVTDYRKYSAAVYTFCDKYGAIPGDMPNATVFWGSLGGTGSDDTCQQTPATSGTATCNGNGDGSVYDTDSSGNPTYYEPYRFWQHLANAGIIERYNGTSYGVGDVPGTNLPISKVSDSLPYFVVNSDSYYAASGKSTYWPTSVYYFDVDFGKDQFMFVSWPVRPMNSNVLTLLSEEAWNTDTKLDDGMPSTVKVIGWKGAGHATCTMAAGQPPGRDAVPPAC